MTIYQHRANSAEDIYRAHASGYGVEVDIRSHLGKFYLSHDPIKDPRTCLPLSRFLHIVRSHKIPAILDIKETGIVGEIAFAVFEHRVEDLVYATDLLFTDHKFLIDNRSGLRVLARASRFERFFYESAGFWLDYAAAIDLEEYISPNRTVVVSPELHGLELDPMFIGRILTHGYLGVCTDYPARYR
jgi:hypothetical protein